MNLHFYFINVILGVLSFFFFFLNLNQLFFFFIGVLKNELLHISYALMCICSGSIHNKMIKLYTDH